MAFVRDTVAAITTTCSRVSTSPPTLKRRTQVFQRQGFSGYGALLLGDGRAEMTITVVQYDVLTGADPAGIDSWRARIEALQGKLINLENDRGEAHSNIFCELIDNPVIRRADVTPGTEAYRAQYRMRCVRFTADA